VAQFWAVIQRLRPAAGRPRQIVLGGLLGICFVFLVALLAIQPTQRLDRALTVALIAFVMAIPLLGFALAFAAEASVPKAGVLPSNGWRMTAWVVDEGLGSVAVLVGLMAVIWHFSVTAVIAFVVASVVALVATFLGTIVSLLVYALRKFNERTAGPNGNASA
jgi:hypothetical protein